MADLTSLIKFFKKLFRILDYPKKTGVISGIDTVVTLKNAVGNDTTIMLSDMYFSLTSKDEAQRFSAETEVDTAKFTVEDHDCDNFSMALMGYWNRGLVSYPFGFALSASHAFNIFIDDQKQVWIVEPQKNKFMAVEEAKQIKDQTTNQPYFPIKFIFI